MVNHKYASAAIREQQVEQLYQANKENLGNSSTNLVLLIMNNLELSSDHARRLTVKQRSDMKQAMSVDIRERIESGMTQREIANELSCSLGRVRAVMKERVMEQAKAETKEALRSMKVTELEDFMTNVSDDVLVDLASRRSSTYQQLVRQRLHGGQA